MPWCTRGTRQPPPCWLISNIWRRVTSVSGWPSGVNTARQPIHMHERDGTMPHRVLLVDDEPDVLAGLRLALRKEPYEILCAHSADEALALLWAQTVDVVVSDQDMPGTTGIAFLARVRH